MHSFQTVGLWHLNVHFKVCLKCLKTDFHITCPFIFHKYILFLMFNDITKTFGLLHTISIEFYKIKFRIMKLMSYCIGKLTGFYRRTYVSEKSFFARLGVLEKINVCINDSGELCIKKFKIMFYSEHKRQF